ncbi:MAG: type II secretion system protein GspK [Candidatus Omnitrophica bacterium]|nr:type II secretion system protein GspK [Candidatus Omnitrophota bacterium]
MINGYRGSILIFVLWVLIVLSLLSIAVSRYSSGDIRLAKYESENIRALYLAKAGIAKMVIEFNKDTNNYDSLNEDWNKEQEFKLGSGEVTYTAYDEESRFNLNSLNLKKEHLVMLGLDDNLSQAVLEYKVNKGDKGFEFAEELFLIDGMTRDIYMKLKDYITIYRGNDPKVNINTASEDILRIVLWQDPLIINKIIVYREGNDGMVGTEDDGVFTEDKFSSIFESFGITPDNVLNYQALFSVRSNFFRITVSASFSENKNIAKHIMAVIDRAGKIYCWKED